MLLHTLSYTLQAFCQPHIHGRGRLCLRLSRGNRYRENMQDLHRQTQVRLVVNKMSFDLQSESILWSLHLEIQVFAGTGDFQPISSVKR